MSEADIGIDNMTWDSLEYMIIEDKADRVIELLAELIDEVRNQGELNRTNATVLVRRLKEKDKEKE